MTRRAAAPGAPEGALVIDKPTGLTSHDVVAVARRALGQPRVGHTGTLDPLASGVLPLLLGRATRLAQFLVADDKAYTATVRLGQATSTGDADGEALGPRIEWRSDPATVEAVLARFRGRFLQTPPDVSAKRIGGRRAYELARSGQAVALAPVEVHVDRLLLTRLDGADLHLDVTCSSGFYVRALAAALGEAFGVGAHLTALRRVRSGAFGLDQALTLDQLTRDPGAARAAVWPMADLAPHLPAVTVSGDGAERLSHGRPVTAEHLTGGTAPTSGQARILAADGALLAVATCRPDALHPVLVLM